MVTLKKTINFFLVCLLFLLFPALAFSQNQSGCLTQGCHMGIEDIRSEDSKMLQDIRDTGYAHGDPAGCIVCHGGDPKEIKDKDKAHKGAPEKFLLDVFVRDPGSIWVAQKTCGLCHSAHVVNMDKALMQTEAGKIQGNQFTWGIQTERKVVWGNYTIEDDDGNTPYWGTDTYREYMTKLIQDNPDQFPQALQQIPKAPLAQESILAIQDEDSLIEAASLTYMRSECQRCHIGVQGERRRGDWRGMGCSACHIPYGTEGYYEGKDSSIPKDEQGHLLVHSIQSSRNSKVKTNGVEYSGIHPETCNSCHNRGKRIGVSYVGMMESPYPSPWMEGGKGQSKIHGKNYRQIKADIHFEGGMACQDCHTSIDMHGDGNIFGTVLAQVEIECTDCHGTPEKFPWELPVGYGDELGQELSNEARGLVNRLPRWMEKFGPIYDPMDGYLLSARGNPLGNLVKIQDKVIIHLANGQDKEVPLTKSKTQKTSNDQKWRSINGKVAMETVQAHVKGMECYACHSDWAPQCYGCHIKVNYADKKMKTDWIASGSTRLDNGETMESVGRPARLFGHAKETRSYLRWETPILGMNGEGRVTPLIPGCQVTYTIITPDGQTAVMNRQAMVPDGPGESKVKGLDMAPVFPHTTVIAARTCENCHSNPKTLGYGIEDGRFMNKQDRDLIVDITDLNTGLAVVKNKSIQIRAIPEMNFDWSQIVTRDDQQLVEVGSHWPLSTPLPRTTRDRMERTGVCIGCHQHMVTPELWSKLAEEKQLTKEEHIRKVSTLLQNAASIK